ncbi:MAG: drug/metabolite transporter (DMT)-like permease [Paracoccaceae bacterium]|jgi:drug/metabolite transporter (DMT)-like permease
MQLSDNMRGAFIMMLSMAAFTLNDVFIKSVSDDMPLFQAVFIRGVMTTSLIAMIAIHQGAFKVHIPRRDWGIIGLRLIGEVGATVFFLTALFNMPLANVTAILQSLPLAITLAGAVFFGEKVGARRYSAIAVGFVGVLIIVRPGTEGFNIYSISTLIAVAFVVLRDLSTRRLSRSVPSVSVALVAAIVVTLMGGAMTAIGDWEPVSSRSVALLGGAAIFIVAGYLSSIMVMRVGEISFIAPFRYTAMIWAIGLGIVVFGEMPDNWTLLGSAIVIGMGIYTFYRERRLEKLKTG